jgi:hypothetical protein
VVRLAPAVVMVSISFAPAVRPRLRLTGGTASGLARP